MTSSADYVIGSVRFRGFETEHRATLRDGPSVASWTIEPEMNPAAQEWTLETLTELIPRYSGPECGEFGPSLLQAAALAIGYSRAVVELDPAWERAVNERHAREAKRIAAGGAPSKY